jgi:hypothetical protein
MQPSNQRLETSSKQTQMPSGKGGANPNGNGNAPDNQQLHQQTARPSPNERRQKQQQQQQSQQNADEPRRVSLAELFKNNEEDGETEIDNDGNPVVDDPSEPPETLDVLSKRLGFKPEQIYNVKIPLADGAEPLTLGQMKDRVGELVDLETRETQFESRRMQVEGELLRSQTEIRELVAMIPKEHINPAIVDKIRKRHETNMAFQRKMTLEHIPEWRDEKRAGEDLQGMVDFTKRWGFDETFMASVHDHRAIKFIRDMYLRDKRIQAALAKVTTPDSKGQRSSAKAKKPAARPMQSNQNRRDGMVPNTNQRLAALFNQSE